MHYLVLVHLEKADIYDDLENEISEQISGYEHQEYDWYQIGGRWTGLFSGKNPEDNENNYAECLMCNGTGFRNDEIGKEHRVKDPTYTCNGCGKRDEETNTWKQGKRPGFSLKWPTQWEDTKDNFIRVEDIKEDYAFHALVSGYSWIGKEFWNPNTENYEKIIKNDLPLRELLKAKEITDGYLVIVDCHN